MVSYQSAVASLYALGHELASLKNKFDLRNMLIMAEALGHPERKFKSVLVAGTNGKGSTSATLASIIQAADYKTALYTSPHLVRVNERIRVNGSEISDAQFTSRYNEISDVARELIATGKLQQQPSFFETLTAMAFQHFAAEGVDIAVLEVGMGGRLDATNIVEPVLSVITDIALDHQQYLGNSVAEIAWEKAGIIRRNGVVVTLPQHPEANDVIGKTAMECNARAVIATKYVPNVSPGAIKFDQLRPVAVQMGAFYRTRYFLEVMGEEMLIETPLIGRHQLRNVALSIAAAEELRSMGFPVSLQEIADGVRNTEWPGRFQYLIGNPDFILDVAHNPAGAWALRSALSEHFEGRHITFIFGGMRDKALGEMAEILFPLAERVVLTRANTPRAASPEEIRSMLRVDAETELSESVGDAIAQARTAARKNALVVVTGSIYIVGEALQILQPQ